MRWRVSHDPDPDYGRPQAVYWADEGPWHAVCRWSFLRGIWTWRVSRLGTACYYPERSGFGRTLRTCKDACRDLAEPPA